jgi:hypothetical protein
LERQRYFLTKKTSTLFTCCCREEQEEEEDQEDHDSGILAVDSLSNSSDSGIFHNQLHHPHLLLPTICDTFPAVAHTAGGAVTNDSDHPTAKAAAVAATTSEEEEGEDSSSGSEGGGGGRRSAAGGPASSSASSPRSRDSGTGSSVSRRHSRASSLDRREMFGKYIHEDNKHGNTIQPFQACADRD